MTDITIQQNADGTGTITIAGVPITPYVAPIEPPVVTDPVPPPVEIASNVVAACEVVINGQDITFADKTVSARALSSVTVGYGLGSSPVEIGAGGSITKTYPKSGTFSAALTAVDDNGVKSVVMFKVVVPGTSDDTYTAGQSSAPPSDSTTDPVSDTPPVAQSAFTLQVMPTSDLPDAVVTGTVNGAAISATAKPGQRVPLVAGDFAYGAATYYPDGCVVIENSYAGEGNSVPADLPCNLTITVGEKIIGTGDIVLWYLSWTRPFWIVTPKAETLDKQFLPNYGAGSENASFATQYAKADNSILGIGMAAKAIGNVGERPDLGIIPGWDAAYVTNPSADNEAVVRGMADASAPWPFHAIDTATNRMMIASDYPKTSLLAPFLGIDGNPFQKFTTACPYLLGQSTGHAVGFNVLACALYGTAYDRASLSQWVNYVGRTWGNYAYALSADGPISMQHVEGCRGIGRTLKSIVQGAKLGEAEHQPMFAKWADQVAGELTTWLAVQTGLQITRAGPGYPGGGYAPWGMHIATEAVGYAIQCGFTQFQTVLDQYAIPIFDSLLTAQHELATVYASGYEKADGSFVTTWAESLQRQGEVEPKTAAALACAENSIDMQAAYNGTTTGTLGGDFMGYPVAPDGRPAILQCALAQLVDHATDQTRAQAAWAKFVQFRRCNFATNPKYNIVPRVAA